MHCDKILPVPCLFSLWQGLLHLLVTDHYVPLSPGPFPLLLLLLDHSLRVNKAKLLVKCPEWKLKLTKPFFFSLSTIDIIHRSYWAHPYPSVRVPVELPLVNVLDVPLSPGNLPELLLLLDIRLLVEPKHLKLQAGPTEAFGGHEIFNYCQGSKTKLCIFRYLTVNFQCSPRPYKPVFTFLHFTYFSAQ